jgi:hypothetical protein
MSYGGRARAGAGSTERSDDAQHETGPGCRRFCGRDRDGRVRGWGAGPIEHRGLADPDWSGLSVSRYELQWMLVINCSIMALYGVAHAIDPEGSIVWGIVIAAAMAGQISSAVRPERRSEDVRQDDDA